ncbi:MAG: hypothetical protein CMB20_004115 [Methanobacteriota archaeon]|nr:MAG: hypothetical protein CMB20_004115 [Euryarchaeota archaeon]|tara:strand:+ start:119 stop:730 length:612 start_codon:yes stop_codon:yes gene_type:complete
MGDSGNASVLSQILNSPEGEKLVGAGLSRRFSKLPLWLSHPSNIGGFYGLLVSLALILPYSMTEEFWLPLWILHASLLIFITGFLGFASRVMSSYFKRQAVTPNRMVLFPMPFVGFTLLALLSTDLLSSSSILVWLSWVLLILPGTLYVHLSWAPRWRMLCMIDEGHYLPEASDEEDVTEDIEILIEEDSDLQEIVESMESEE